LVGRVHVVVKNVDRETSTGTDYAKERKAKNDRRSPSKGHATEKVFFRVLGESRSIHPKWRHDCGYVIFLEIEGTKILLGFWQHILKIVEVETTAENPTLKISVIAFSTRT